VGERAGSVRLKAGLEGVSRQSSKAEISLDNAFGAEITFWGLRLFRERVECRSSSLFVFLLVLLLDPRSERRLDGLWLLIHLGHRQRDDLFGG
jgi:hypothetical protein